MSNHLRALETFEEFQSHLQAAMLELLRSTPIVPHNEDGWAMMADAVKKVWDSLPVDDPRKQIRVEAIPQNEEDRNERRAPAIWISGPRAIMEQLFDPQELIPIPPMISVNVTVEL